jgi:hypothetical protein
MKSSPPSVPVAWAKVYRARDPRLDRVVAIKWLTYCDPQIFRPLSASADGTIRVRQISSRFP